MLRDGERYFLMRRTRAGADARLHDRYSIGVGGHLNPGDGDLLGGLRREWAEELVADFEPDVPARRAAQRRHDRGRRRPPRARSTSPTPAGRPVDVRETDKLEGALRRPATRSRRSSTGSRPGAGSCSTAMPARTAATPLMIRAAARPIIATPGAQAGDTDPDHPRGGLMAAKILVVDDDPNVQRLLQYTLKQEGYDVVVAADGAEGFRLWGAEAPDLILLDVAAAQARRLPGRDQDPDRGGRVRPRPDHHAHRRARGRAEGPRASGPAPTTT